MNPGGGGGLRMPQTGGDRPSGKAIEYAHELLSALFMAVRTAQLHEPNNAAYEAAVQRVHQSAAQLQAATGGFELQFVEESLFLNGTRLRFESGTYASMRTLRGIMEARGVGGFRMRVPPTYQVVHKLLAVLAAGARGGDTERERQLLEATDVKLLGIRRVVDVKDPVKVDRPSFALHSYAKLLVALEERRALLEGGQDARATRPLVRIERVVQGLVELAGDRADLLLKLSSNGRGAAPEQLMGANACVLSLALGHALGFDRRELADLGVAALLHHLEELGPHGDRVPVLGRFLAESAAGQGLFVRAMLFSDPPGPSPRADGGHDPEPHPLCRVLRVATAYARLVTGAGLPGGIRRTPSEALNALRSDRSGWLDPRVVDLALNLLRVFPVGVPVALDSGDQAVVMRRTDRADRPVVQTMGGAQPVNLSQTVETTSVVGTLLFLGLDVPRPSATTADIFPEVSEAEPEEPGLPLPPDAIIVMPDLAPSMAPVSAPPARATSRRAGAFELLPAQGRRQESAEPSLPADPPRAAQRMGPASRGDDPGLARAPAPRPEPTELGIGEGRAAYVPTVGSPAPTAPVVPATSQDRLIGALLGGKYRVLSKLGEGGMGTVFLAHHETIDRQVAVKVLLSSLMGDAVAMHRFEREARTISRMRHPNTVTIFDFGQTPDRDLYIVMEHLTGETVGDVLRREGRLEPLRATRIIRQVCASLREAHALGVIHRDLKPDNIFLTHIGEEPDFVKVLDFGLAKLSDNEQTSRITQQGKVFGTPLYMSPEQASGAPLDHRSDIYALGVLLYEMLCGATPFAADTVLALLLKHIQEPPPRPSVVRPELGLDPRLEAAVMRALEKDPAQRPQSVGEFARALDAWERSASARWSSAVEQGTATPGDWRTPTPLSDIAADLWLDQPTPMPFTMRRDDPWGVRTPAPLFEAPFAAAFSTPRPEVAVPPRGPGEGVTMNAPAAARAPSPPLAPFAETGGAAEPWARAIPGGDEPAQAARTVERLPDAPGLPSATVKETIATSEAAAKEARPPSLELLFAEFLQDVDNPGSDGD
jgi:serine/threonine protein kinase